MKILLTEFTGLGNFILTCHAIKFLEKQKLRITIVGNNKYHGLDFLKFVYKKKIKLINFEKISLKSKINLYYQIYKKKYQEFIIGPASAPNNFLLILIFFIGRLNIIYNSDFKYNSNFFVKFIYKLLIKFNNFINHNKYSVQMINIEKGSHEIRENLKLMFRNKINNFNVNNYNSYKFNLKKNIFNEKILIKLGLKKRTYIVFQPLSSSGNLTPKNWSLEKFLYLAELYNNLKINIVIIGDIKEKNILKNFFVPPYINNLVGKTNFKELVNLLYFSKGIVCLDSGIVHLANAINVKTIGLFGCTDNTKVMPFGINTKVISKNVECSPCIISYSSISNSQFKFKSEKEAFLNCQNNFKCMETIDAQEVFDISCDFFKIKNVYK